MYFALNNNVSILMHSRASLVTQMVKNMLAMQETWLRSLGGEDPLEKRTENHSGLLAWRIHGQRSLAIVHGIAKSQTQLSD